MNINSVIKEANDVEEKYNLQDIEVDRTDNIIILKLLEGKGAGCFRPLPRY